jgi:hypothetical protein
MAYKGFVHPDLLILITAILYCAGGALSSIEAWILIQPNG